MPAGEAAVILEEIRADEPFPVALRLHPRLTVVVGLGPKRRAWLASAVADAMAGRETSLWGVADVVGMRVDLGDSLVVRASAGLDPTMGPELWRSDYYGPDGAHDDLWPPSSLPESSRGRVAFADLERRVAAAPSPLAAASPAATASPARRRRWRRSAAGPSGAPNVAAPGLAEEAVVDPWTGSLPPALTVPPLVQLPPDEPPEVPPSVAVADPPRPPILDEPGPPVPGPMTIPPRPVVREPADGREEAPAPPPGPANPDAAPPPDAGPRPVAPDPPPPLPPQPPVDPRLERRVAELAHDPAGSREQLASRRAAASAVVVAPIGDAGAVAHALGQLEACRAAAAAAGAHARRLADRWRAAEEEAARARTSRVPPWLLESARRSLDQARQELAEADAEQPLDPVLVDRLEAAVGEAEAVWAELHSPRDDAAAAEAAAHMAEVWSEVTAFLGHRPSDVLGALTAPEPVDPAAEAAEVRLAAALRAQGVEPPGAIDSLVEAARTWLGVAEDRAAAAEAGPAADLERWPSAVAEHERWAAGRQEAQAAYEHELGGHQAAVAAFRRDRRAAVEAAPREADEAWEVTVAGLRAEHERRRSRRAAWERRREAAEARWQAELAAAAAERRRLEEERAAALAALAAWEERHVPAPDLPELRSMLLQRVAAAATAGPGGAVPLVVDDALSSLPMDVAAVLFGVFVQVSSTVQVVYLTDDPATIAIARRLDGVPVLAAGAEA